MNGDKEMQVNRRQRKPRREFLPMLGRMLRAFGLAAVLAVWAVPVIWTVVTSIKPRTEIFTVPPTLIFTPTIEHYVTALELSGIFSSIANSLLIALVVVLVTLLLAVPAGYAYARIRFRFSRFMSFFTLFTQMAPQIGVLIPIFLMVHRAGLYDTYPSIVMVHLTITLPISVWLMITYFETVPKEMEESAVVDGASYFSAFTRVVVPQVRGGIAVCAILGFIESWNEFLFVSVLTGQNTETIQVEIFSFMTAEETAWGPFTATGIMIMLPAIILAILAQKQLIRGLTFGAVKG